jgi:SAM-dependent methyltransferase
MKQLIWSSDREFTVDGVRFECAPLGDYAGKTNQERFLLLKDRGSLEQYAAVFEKDQPKNILEFGIFQGGSPALFSLWFEAQKFVGIDLSEPVAPFDEFCRTHPVGKKISTHYRTSQNDRARVEKIVQHEFGSTPIDLIIDDASHYYDYTRETFEIAFPLLRPGGTYVIEDWGWAHWPHVHSHYMCRKPLSILVMELLMLCASRSDLISEVRVYPAFAFIHKSPLAQPVEDFVLDKLYVKRNLEIMEPHLLNFSEIKDLVGKKVRERTERRVRRTKEKIQRAVKGKSKR